MYVINLLLVLEEQLNLLFLLIAFPRGCFSGNGKVELKNKTFKNVKDLIKGDTLKNGAIVICLIKIKVNKIQQVI